MRTVASLEECFSLEAGRVYLTGVQALVRVVLDHQRAELRRACDTATFVSGYPGSPLGGLDRELDRQLAAFPELAITHVPGLNEDLAATAVWGETPDEERSCSGDM